jgi:soluble lytic murein transglycosylase-like protein
MPDVSSAGGDGEDIGLMQFGPAEAAIAGGAYTYEPAANILTGSKYLEYLRERYAGGNLDVSIEMYNAGPGNPAGGYSYLQAVLRNNCG